MKKKTFQDLNLKKNVIVDCDPNDPKFFAIWTDETEMTNITLVEGVPYKFIAEKLCETINKELFEVKEEVVKPTLENQINDLAGCNVAGRIRCAIILLDHKKLKKTRKELKDILSFVEGKNDLL